MLLGYIWLLGTFANSSCDKNKNGCRNLAVKGLSLNCVHAHVVDKMPERHLARERKKSPPQPFKSHVFIIYII